MNRALTLAVLCGVIVISVQKAEAQTQVQKVDLSVEDAISAYGALRELDGYEAVTDDRTVKVPYQLSGALRMKIARDQIILKGVVDTFQVAREGKIQEILKGVDLGKATPEQRSEASREVSKMLKAKQSLELERLNPEELLGPKEANPLPPSLLAQLQPLLTPRGQPK